jgi:outer membrane protein assembly factor BamB
MKSLVLAALICLVTLAASAANWPQWRGPNSDGSSPEKNLPVKWSKTENIAWSLPLPGPGAGTPVIWENHVFVSTTDKSTRSVWAICAHRKTGAVMWKHKVADVAQKDDRSTFASPSPATDGKRVFFFYGNGDLVAFDFAGNKLWSRNIQKDEGDFAFLWTFSTSPLLYDGKLYMQVLQRDMPVQGRGKKPSGIESYLLAMDPATGKTLWRHVRPSEASQESLEAFTSPVPFEHGGRKEILVVGGDCISGHDPVSGKEFWRWGTWNPQRIGHWRLVPSPVAGAGIVLACAPKGGPIYGIAAGANGNLSDGDFAWKGDPQRGISSDVPTPLFYDGDFFVWSDVKKNVSRVDPKTGQVKWTVETPGRSKYESSPSGADGKIYGMNFKGEVVVVDAAKGEILGTIPMGEEGDDMTRSSIAIAGGQLFIRTNGKLYCVGKTQVASN